MSKIIRMLVLLLMSTICANIQCREQSDFNVNESLEEKPIVVIIPSYKNEAWYEQNLNSVLSQKYSNYRVIYIEDCSPDRTYDLVYTYISERGHLDRVTLIHNEKRQGAMANLYYAIHSCNDWELVVLLDGDDWFPHENVLSYINEIYNNPHVWLTYGQFIEYPSKRRGFCEDFPQHVIETNSYRQYGLPVSHLRTFYAWLFKEIKKEDLMWNGGFFSMTWDKAMMAPMLEMAGGRFKFLSKILYVYNFVNPLNDCKVDGDLQAHLANVIRAMETYEPLKDIPEHLSVPDWYNNIVHQFECGS